MGIDIKNVEIYTDKDYETIEKIVIDADYNDEIYEYIQNNFMVDKECIYIRSGND